MSKTANIMTRVEPQIKEQAEVVLEQLGISMSTAMSIYLRQIALHKKIPFDMALPNTMPVSLNSLSDEEFNSLMEQSVKSYANGNAVGLEDFAAALNEELAYE